MLIEKLQPSSDQLKKKNVYLVRMHTTGLGPDDEILELCVIDARAPWREGKAGRKEPAALFHRRFRPGRRTAWPEAFRVNGISPEAVASCPSLDDFREELSRLFLSCDCLVAFNADFDFSFLRRQFPFRAGLMTVDLMRDWTDFAAGSAGPGESLLDIPFQTQKQLFEHFSWPASRSLLSDCLGLRHCFLQLIPLNAVRIRRPFQERRVSRSTGFMLEEVQEAFAARARVLCAGAAPFLSLTIAGDEVQVRCGVRDPERLFCVQDPPETSFSLPLRDESGPLRERLAARLSAAAELPPGLRGLAADALLDRLPAAEQEDSAPEENAPGGPSFLRAGIAPSPR